jgi:hypothetical protein
MKDVDLMYQGIRFHADDIVDDEEGQHHSCL